MRHYYKGPTAAEVIEDSCVHRLQYDLDDDGRVHVRGAPGIGEHILQELSRHGYAIQRQTHIDYMVARLEDMERTR